MDDTKIRDALTAAAAYLGEHPAEARYKDSAATAVLETGLAVTVTGPDGASVRTDMPTSVGGDASAPSSGWLLRAGQASCLATLIAMRAAQEGVDLRRIEVTVESESDDRGILGLDDSVQAGPLSSRAVVNIEANSVDRAQVQALVDWADVHCPVQDAVRRAIPVHVEVLEPQ
ncbi:MAG: OsmC family protein [Candidatus Dormiibacterota bacterium]